MAALWPNDKTQISYKVLILYLIDSLLDLFVGINKYIHITYISSGFHAVNLKEEETDKFLPNLIHLSKSHGYALELNPIRVTLRKLSIYEIEDQPAARMAESRSRWADRGWYVVLKCMTLDEFSTFAKNGSF